MKKSYYVFSKSKYIILIISIIICFAVLFTVKKSKPTIPLDDRGNEIIPLNIPIETVESYGGYWCFMPASENDVISYDINSIFVEKDNTHYFLVPGDIDDKKVVFYVRDTADQICFKVDGDFSKGPIPIGSSYVNIIKTQFPVMQIQLSETSPSLNDICNDTTQQTYGYGDLGIRTTAQYSHDNSCPVYFKSNSGNIHSIDSITLLPRGNGTWSIFNKIKPFTLAFNESVSIIGMTKNKKWNLLANASDRTLLKNKLFYELADSLGINYMCENEYVALYINNRYQGLYLLTTKVSVDKNRVNLNEGDFFVNYGGSKPREQIYINTDLWFSYDGKEHPYFDLLWPENDLDIEWKQDFLQEMMDAIADTDSDEYLNYIDLDSFVKNYWIQEFSMNIDASCRSLYMYYDSDDEKMHIGPIWDMDLTLGANINVDGIIDMTNPEGWKCRNFPLFKALCEHDTFINAVNEYYYNEKIRDELQKFILNMNDGKKMLKAEGQLELDMLGSEAIDEMLKYDTDSYEEWCDLTIDFAQKRFDWIDEQMATLK